jgi:hypothetical protein
MAKKQSQHNSANVKRTSRAKVSPKESLKRLHDFAKRKGAFIAAVRKGKDRGVSA